MSARKKSKKNVQEAGGSAVASSSASTKLKNSATTKELHVGVTWKKAYQSAFKYHTGGYKEVFDSLTGGVIYNLTKRKDKEAHFWIGVTSGGLKGCKDRWNQKYKDLGMTDFYRLYETTSADFRAGLETLLIDWCQKNKYNIDNDNQGGGGGHGEAPYTVYLAVDRS